MIMSTIELDKTQALKQAITKSYQEEDSFYRNVHTLSYKFSRQEREDTAQTAMVKLIEKANKYDFEINPDQPISQDPKLSAWATRVIRNDLIDSYRRRNTKTQDIGDKEFIIPFYEPSDYKFSKQEIVNTIKTLSPTRRKVALRLALGKDIAEIAECLNLSESCIRWHRTMIKRELKKGLQKILENETN